MPKPELDPVSLRVSIVGSGPSAFYAADALFKSGHAVSIDMFESLPTPYGLVRGGVAPDHPKIKNVTRVFEKVARQPGFSFWGNVHVGRDLALDELRRYYDAIIMACGAQTDRRLNIPGEDIPGSHTATEFVGWYNGHPDYRDRIFDLGGETAVIIGMGNVAIDVARILAKSPDDLRETDIAAHALDALAESRLKNIYLVGRRGPVQARFTLKEIQELGNLENCSMSIDPEELEISGQSRVELDAADNRLGRENLEILKSSSQGTQQDKPRTCHMGFFKSPVKISGDQRIRELVLELNTLQGEPFRLKAVGTGKMMSLPCDILFRSVGYRGVEIPGLPFDAERGLIPNIKGRVEPGVYCVGWIKRGPSGVIGTNKPDSVESVNSLLADLDELPRCPVADSSGLRQLLESRKVRIVDFQDWSRIDEAEVNRGKGAGKPREKFTRREEMLDLLTDAVP
jgi:ferredoxin--NADP+ reductase